MRARDGLNLQNYRYMIYRAKGAAVKEMEGEWKISFPLLAPHLVELMRVNSASVVALRQSIFSLFCVFNVCISSHSYNVPVAGLDGIHSRHGK